MIEVGLTLVCLCFVWPESTKNVSTTFLPLQHLNHLAPNAIVVWLDFTKCGTLGKDTLGDSMEEIRRILSAFPNRAAAMIIAPYLTSSKAIAGKRGELRTECFSYS